ncbi:MAG: efflux RND transporter periplasmic adaptor subunit [Planctomycetota bacterium]|jgi:Cu(I)/Ag(I) efflux system membrane fusion protein
MGRLLGNPRTIAIVAASVVAAFFIGFLVRGSGSGGGGGDTSAAEAEAEPLFWTCSMHPQINQPGPGQCPLCGMDLIPVHKEAGEKLDPRELRLSESARKLADVQTAPVERKFVTAQVSMVGRVEYDETRVRHITSWVGGRLDRLYVDYTGVTVRKGDHMVWLYSPEILAAQEELLQAVKAVGELSRSGSKNIRRTALQTVAASREKLRLWGLTPKQIEQIETRGTPEDHITIYSPVGGVVVQKHVAEGMYVKTGARIYGIVDLTQVWVKLDAYESDLAWVKYGQEVEFSTEAYAGEVFTGKIAFIDPILDAKTRTVKLRVNVPNKAGRLKPGMFVRATVRPKVALGGKVVDPVLAGKWICPMHPEIVKDGPAKCDICEMPLEPAEDLGYVTPEKGTAPLVIPVTAPLRTGKRAVVYVADPEKEGVFEGRLVVLGPRAEGYYIVEEGLEEGERVVTRGNFKIDSALQILAKPSMMNPQGGGPAPGGHHGGHGASASVTPPAPKRLDTPEEFRKQLGGAFEAYLRVQGAFAGDKLKAGTAAAKDFLVALDRIDMMLVKEPAHSAWMKELMALKSRAQKVARSSDFASAREAFSPLSDAVIRVAKIFGMSDAQELHVYRCTMALDGRGANWLSGRKEVRNPYYGASMLKCGDLVETISAGNDKR